MNSKYTTVLYYVVLVSAAAVGMDQDLQFDTTNQNLDITAPNACRQGSLLPFADLLPACNKTFEYYGSSFQTRRAVPIIEIVIPTELIAILNESTARVFQRKQIDLNEFIRTSALFISEKKYQYLLALMNHMGEKICQKKNNEKGVFYANVFFATLILHQAFVTHGTEENPKFYFDVLRSFDSLGKITRFEFASAIINRDGQGYEQKLYNNSALWQLACFIAHRQCFGWQSQSADELFSTVARSYKSDEHDSALTKVYVEGLVLHGVIHFAQRDYSQFFNKLFAADGKLALAVGKAMDALPELEIPYEDLSIFEEATALGSRETIFNTGSYLTGHIAAMEESIKSPIYTIEQWSGIAAEVGNKLVQTIKNLRVNRILYPLAALTGCAFLYRLIYGNNYSTRTEADLIDQVTELK